MTALFPFLLQAAATVAAPVQLGEIGRQTLPAKGCAAFLWRNGPSPALVAMIGADPAMIRLVVDGKRVDAALASVEGDAVLGLPAKAQYRSDAVEIAVEMTVTPQPNLLNGARVSSGLLSVRRAAGDATVVPVAGLAGCAATKP